LLLPLHLNLQVTEAGETGQNFQVIKYGEWIGPLRSRLHYYHAQAKDIYVEPSPGPGIPYDEFRVIVWQEWTRPHRSASYLYAGLAYIPDLIENEIPGKPNSTYLTSWTHLTF
jgi:hypothetical protein